MLAALDRYAGWSSTIAWRASRTQRVQSVPVDWGIRSERKRGFFSLLARVTGAGAEGA